MKKRVLISLMLVVSSIAFSQSHLETFFNKSDVFFKTYVKEGKVNYEKVASNSQDLNAVLLLSNQVKVSVNDAANYQSFWINAYNLMVIKQLAEVYPVKSPMDITGFFDVKKLKIGGKMVSLNHIENKLLRANFKEARFHFVLVCGALSCPPIINKAYLPGSLEEQLQAQTVLALNNPDFIKVNTRSKNVGLSEILKWYKGDFTSNGTVLDFVNSYRENKIPSDYKATYYSYNWEINEIKGDLTTVKKKARNLEITTVVQADLKESMNTTASFDVKMKEKENPVQESNIRKYTPSKLLAQGAWDFKVFNNLYTQTKRADENGKISKNLDRETYFTSTVEVYTGIGEKAKINIGIIANIKSNLINSATTDFSATKVFEFKNVDGLSRTGLTSIAPSIKFSPIKNVSNFTVQSSFFIPLIKNESEQGVFLDKNSFTFENKFFYDRTFGADKFQFFAELDLAYHFGDKEKGYANNSLSTPVSAFLSYFPSDAFTVYVNGQHFQLFDLGNDFSQNFTLLGLGTKYQLTNALNLELSYANFIRGNSTGLGQTFNLGLRYLLTK